MRTKILKLTVFIVIAQIFLYACCGDEFNVFIDGISTRIVDDADDDITSVRNEDFSLYVEPSYDTEMISSLSKSSGLINMAYATSCDDVFYKVNLVTAIKVEANVDLFGIPAGESLNAHVITNSQYNDTNTFTIDELILRLNDTIGFGDGYFFRFDNEIPIDTTTTFTITFTLEDAQQFTETSTAVTFE